MALSLLLIAPESLAESVADALRRDLDAEVEVATTRRAALVALRRREYTLILLEDSLVSADPDAAEVIYSAAAATPVVEIHCVLSRAERIVRQVRGALLRRNRDRDLAAAEAASQLHGQLATALAGILLESQLALREANPSQEPKLRRLVSMAGDLSMRLRA